MTDYSPHPAAELFPLTAGAEFETLVKDIREHGQREPIVLHDETILDGRNRYRACLEADVVPRFIDWDGQGSVESFIISKNLHRLHLTTSQRSMVAGRLANLDVGRPKEYSANLQNISQDSEISQEQAAELLNVSLRSVSSAKVVIDSGDDDLIRAVDTGGMSLGKAAQNRREYNKQVNNVTPKKYPKRKKPSAAANTAGAATSRRYGVLARQLYDGLEKITGLPDIETMIKATNKKHDILTTKVPMAINWLNNFSHALSERIKTDGIERSKAEVLQHTHHEETQSQGGTFDASGGDQAA